MSEAGEAQARLESAVGRLGGALERINDGVDRIPEPSAAAPAAGAGSTEEMASLRSRIEQLETENDALRAAGRMAAEGIGETIAALQSVRN